MQQSGRLRLGGGNIGSLTPETILYGKATNISDIDYNKITINKLSFISPLTITNRESGKNNTSNEISIDSNLIYFKDEINSIFQYKLINGFGININNNSNISVNFSDGGWSSNKNSNYLYTYSSNIGIGLNNPEANLHIYNSNPSFIIQKPNNQFNFSFTNDNYFSLNNKIKINNAAKNNTLLIENDYNIHINSNLYINGILNINNSFNSNFKILINDISIIEWLISSNDIATKNFVQNNQNITDNTILKGIGSNIRYIDYNNITKNRLSFISPLFINDNN